MRGRTDVALRDLVDRGVLTAGQATEVRAALTHASQPVRAGRWWAELAGYLGGVLVLGGAFLLSAAAWDRLTDPVRGALLVGIAVALSGAGMAIAGGPAALRRLAGLGSTARRRVVAVLFALAAAAAAGAAAVVTDEHPAVAAGAAGLLVALAGYAALPSVPGLLGSAAASLLLTTSAATDFGVTSPFGVGVVLLLLGTTWIVLAAVGVAGPRPIAFGIGATLAFVGAQQPIGQPGAQGWTYAFTATVAVACFALYRWQRDVVLLVAGVVGVAISAPEAVWDWTDGAAGGAVVLLVAGAALIAASAAGLRLWRTQRIASGGDDPAQPPRGEGQKSSGDREQDRNLG